jgi:uncharacterized protein (DUF1800 family)
MPDFTCPARKLTRLSLECQSWPSLLRALGCALLLALAGCGGGGGGAGQTPNSPPTERSGSNQIITPPDAPTNDTQAYRFLTQATFGPTPNDAEHLKTVGYEQWIDEQFEMQLAHPHVQTADRLFVERGTGRSDGFDVTYSWWTNAIRDPAQLRQRVAFALSQIFVVSTLTVDNGRMVAHYLDMLTNMADAKYRDLLESVAMHPAMGQYLSHMGNRKADQASGRVPDENFAREVMQLFSIGLHQLDDAARPVLVNSQPVETYGASDVSGLARVFTGFSWYRPPELGALAWWECFWRSSNCNQGALDINGMSAYAEAHEPGAKSFLLKPGETETVLAKAISDPRLSLKIALDRLASHPNTAPFISKQLIQRLVTSNPSDEYVRDITRVFRSSDGHLKAVVKAILLHKDARTPTTEDLASSYGKLREPLIRFTHLARTLPHRSITYDTRVSAGQIGYYLVDDTSDPGFALGQTPMRAPSVFNFYRPGYKPPLTALAHADKVAPEFQITNEASVLGYANFVAQSLAEGWGRWANGSQIPDIQFDLSSWQTMANKPAELIDAMALRLLGRTLPTASRDEAISALAAMPSGTTAYQRERVQAAILMLAVSPEFIVQQ